MSRIRAWQTLVLLIPLLFASTDVRAIYDPDDDKLVYWEGCDDPDANCTPGSDEEKRNKLYKQELDRSVVKINIGTHKCTGLYI